MSLMKNRILCQPWNASYSHGQNFTEYYSFAWNWSINDFDIYGMAETDIPHEQYVKEWNWVYSVYHNSVYFRGQ